MTFLYAVSGKFDLIISFLLFKKFSHAIALLYSKRTEISFLISVLMFLSSLISNPRRETDL
ncbi:hypothetical protein KKKH12_03760 [Helicobacter pylori]